MMSGTSPYQRALTAEEATGTDLDLIPLAILADDAIGATRTQAEVEAATAAAVALNHMIMDGLAATGALADGQITAAEIEALNAWFRETPEREAQFLALHGNNGAVTTGFHLAKDAGATATALGFNLIENVADSVYHIGFVIEDGVFRNEDGAANAKVNDIATALNYLVLKAQIVAGTEAGDLLWGWDESGQRFEALGGDDLISAGAGSDRVYAGAGNDSIDAAAGCDHVWCGDGDDMASGGGSADMLFGEDGSDLLSGGLGNDTLEGGSGNDTLEGGGGRDVLDGGDDADAMSGGDDADALRGGAGDDTLGGDAGNDLLEGGDGADLMSGGAEDDWMSGDEGDDALYGGTGADTLLGGTGDDVLAGEDGDDSLEGGDGADILAGGAGNDQLRGGTATAETPNQLWGGDGIDSVSYAGAPSPVMVDLAAFVTYSGGTLVDYLNGVENVVGTAGDDGIAGDGADNRIEGGGGSDQLLGRGGSDVFVYGSATDSSLATGYDIIGDFVSGVDRIDLTAFGITAAAARVELGAGWTALHVDTDPLATGEELNIAFIGSGVVSLSDLVF